MSHYLFYSLLALLGLAAGSFLNVVILRYAPAGKILDRKRLSGRSHCMHCGKTLTWKELIPVVSFLIQRGRCKSCRKRLTVQYPLIELASAATFVGVPLFLNSFFAVYGAAFISFGSAWWYYILVAAWILAFLAWVAAAAIDIRHFVVPDELTIFIFILGVAVTVIMGMAVTAGEISLFKISFLRHFGLLFTSFENPFALHAIGAVAGGALFSLFHFVSRGKAMGFGDVKLAFASGALLGWPDLGLAVMLAFILGGIWGVLLIALNKKEMRDKVPFAPFFVAGALLTFFFGFEIVQGYFRLFSI